MCLGSARFLSNRHEDDKDVAHVFLIGGVCVYLIVFL